MDSDFRDALQGLEGVSVMNPSDARGGVAEPRRYGSAGETPQRDTVSLKAASDRPDRPGAAKR